MQQLHPGSFRLAGRLNRLPTFLTVKRMHINHITKKPKQA